MARSHSIQESLALESEEDFSSSDQSEEDSEEDRLYFEKRIDPKEDFLIATRKKTATAATGGGPPVAAFTPAEELALEQNSRRPIIVGIEGGITSDPVCPHDVKGGIHVQSSKLCKRTSEQLCSST
ncbi:hypothetical protein MHYP_G00205780 [Metynnis hypsauchen]